MTEVNFTGTGKYSALLTTPYNAENTGESRKSRGNCDGSNGSQALKPLPRGFVISFCHQGAINKLLYILCTMRQRGN